MEVEQLVLPVSSKDLNISELISTRSMLKSAAIVLQHGVRKIIPWMRMGG